MKPIITFVSFIFFFLLTIGADISADGKLARERSYDVLNYRLNIELDEKAKTCDGDVTITLLPLRSKFDTLILDAAEMEISSVFVNGRTEHFKHDHERLIIALSKSFGLTDTIQAQISYSVTSPKKGLYFIVPDSGYPGKRYQIWSQGQPEDNHYWFPCYDYPNDKATSEVNATVNDRFTVISNGKLLDVKKDSKNHQATYHWYESKPFSSYLISIVAGEYIEVKDLSKYAPVVSYVYPDQRGVAQYSFAKTKDMVDHFSKITGFPYPWEKYGQVIVQDFIYGGMENVSASTLTDATMHDERSHGDVSSDGLVAHELAHQWFGDCVTPRDWSHAWLSEGFASYFDILFQEHDKGMDQVGKSMLDTHRGVMFTDAGINKHPTVWNRYKNPEDLYDAHIYGKGASVLHMLRFMLGDELFWKGMNEYLKKYAYGLVETEDFERAMEDATGYNLTWFFNQWIYKAGFPVFEITTNYDQGNQMLHVLVKQTQEIDSLTGIFQTPVDVQIWSGDNPTTRRIMITKQEEDFTFPLFRSPQLVLFDKGNWILKKAVFNKTQDEWKFQLQHAEDAVDKLLAIDEIKWSVETDSSAASILTNAMFNDRFWQVRQQAAYALGKSKKRETPKDLIKAYGDIDSRVRTGVVASLGNYSGDEIIKTVKLAFEKDKSYAVVASALGSLKILDSTNIKQYCASALKRESNREIIRATTLRVLSEVGDEESFGIVKKYTMYGYPTTLRQEALQNLSSHWKNSEDVLDYLISLLQDPSFHIRRSVMSILGGSGKEKAIDPLKQSVATETDARLIKLANESIQRIEKDLKQGK